MTAWRKSLRCGASTGCVETARLSADEVGVRDSKHAETSPVLAFSLTAWAAFRTAVTGGRYDLR